MLYKVTFFLLRTSLVRSAVNLFLDSLNCVDDISSRFMLASISLWHSVHVHYFLQ